MQMITIVKNIVIMFWLQRSFKVLIKKKVLSRKILYSTMSEIGFFAL